MTEMDPSKKMVDTYLKREILGEGTYGVVYKAIDSKTRQTVVIKKIRLGKQQEGVNFTAVGEIEHLKELKDSNIIELEDAFLHKDDFERDCFLPQEMGFMIDPQDGPTVLSPPRKSRRVMPDCDSNKLVKIDKHVGEVRTAAGDQAGKSEQVPMSVDFSIFWVKTSE